MTKGSIWGSLCLNTAGEGHRQGQADMIHTAGKVAHSDPTCKHLCGRNGGNRLHRQRLRMSEISC